MRAGQKLVITLSKTEFVIWQDGKTRFKEIGREIIYKNGTRKKLKPKNGGE